jgi:2-hydroxy-6-oxonona-2,4-dienedioate hydrolase
MSTHEKDILVDGLNVHYWDKGDSQSPAILLIHGGLGDAKLHWEPVLPILAETFRVLAPDLPGFGNSEALPINRTDVLLHWVKSFIDAHQLEQVVLVGNAFGALIVRLFAAANPKYAPAVILINGGGVPELPAFFKVADKIPGLSTLIFAQFGKMMTNPSTLQRLIHIKSVLNDDFYADAKNASRPFSHMLQMMVRSGIPAERTPLVPTLILWGIEDTFTPPGDREAIKDSIPGAVLTEIADCGHMPQLETPDVFSWQITTFLKKLSRPQTAAKAGPKLLRKLSG